MNSNLSLHYFFLLFGALLVIAPILFFPEPLAIPMPFVLTIILVVVGGGLTIVGYNGVNRF